MSPFRDDEEIKDLEIPDFKSNIPGYLADGLTPKERHVLDALSIIAQKQDFLFRVLQEDRSLVRVIKKRTDKYEKLLLILTSKWSVVLYILAAVYPILSTKLLNKLFP